MAKSPSKHESEKISYSLKDTLLVLCFSLCKCLNRRMSYFACASSPVEKSGMLDFCFSVQELIINQAKNKEFPESTERIFSNHWARSKCIDRHMALDS